MALDLGSRTKAGPTPVTSSGAVTAQLAYSDGQRMPESLRHKPRSKDAY